MKKRLIYIMTLAALLIMAGCRQDEVIFLSEDEPLTPPQSGAAVTGFYQLNEGNMGMNRATLDYFDYTTGRYHRDIFSARNPQVVKELGDVGNDLQVYGNKLYAVINVSNLVVVFDVKTARMLQQITVPNARYMAFYEGKAYVSSYAGKVAVDPNAEQGMVVEIDTTSLQLTGRQVTVGYQPEEMAVWKGKLYVANSGGYRHPQYDRTVSVIDLQSFTEVKKIDVDINLHRMQVDKEGDIYVSSRGNYADIPSRLYVIDSGRDEVKQRIDMPVNGMTLCGDSLYFYSVVTNRATSTHQVKYGIWNTHDDRLVTDHLITDGTEKSIMLPYGIGVNPETKEILIGDAQNYVVTGFIYCYRPDGKLKWKTEAGNIPGHFAFVREGLTTSTSTPPTPAAVTSHIKKVYDYRPAPGQHVNTMPQWQAGDTQEQMNAKVLNNIGEGKEGMITLGGYGGYVIVGFDQPIVNREGQRDFRIKGNFYYMNEQPDPTRKAGNSEPGIVMVSYDANNNGLPDDDWYELAGSEYHKNSTLKQYQITYHRPTSHTPKSDPNHAYIIDKEHVKWTDNQGSTGYIPQNSWHQQSYYPAWIASETLSFTGTLLPPNGVQYAVANSEQAPTGKTTYQPEFWALYPYAWGYADNAENHAEGSTFDIDWAVDKHGSKVSLRRIDFIKVYTGVQQVCGWLGDTSTEITGIVDLNRVK